MCGLIRRGDSSRREITARAGPSRVAANAKPSGARGLRDGADGKGAVRGRMRQWMPSPAARGGLVSVDGACFMFDEHTWQSSAGSES